MYILFRPLFGGFPVKLTTFIGPPIYILNIFFRPLFGGFPVKLTTYIGPPIYINDETTPEQLRDQCKVGFNFLKGLMSEFQLTGH